MIERERYAMKVSTSSAERDPEEQLTLRAAAKLAGMPREYLEECVASGRLAVHLHHKGDATKFRVTRTAMHESGLLEPLSSPLETNDALVSLLRDQAQRLAEI